MLQSPSPRHCTFDLCCHHNSSSSSIVLISFLNLLISAPFSPTVSFLVSLLRVAYFSVIFLRIWPKIDLPHLDREFAHFLSPALKSPGSWRFVLALQTSSISSLQSAHLAYMASKKKLRFPRLWKVFESASKRGQWSNVVSSKC